MIDEQPTCIRITCKGRVDGGQRRARVGWIAGKGRAKSSPQEMAGEGWLEGNSKHNITNEVIAIFPLASAQALVNS